MNYSLFAKNIENHVKVLKYSKGYQLEIEKFEKKSFVSYFIKDPLIYLRTLLSFQIYHQSIFHE